MTRCLAVVPAFDEERAVGGLVRELRAAAPDVEVLVVDDGSGDATAEEARRAGARVLRLPFNCGIGAAVQAGLGVAVAEGFERVARLDGDAQHDPADLPRLLARLDAGDADFVVGSRFGSPDGFRATPLRRLGSRWFAWLLRVLCGVSVDDPTSGFWAADARAARVLLASYASDYPEVDSLLHVSRQGLRIAQEPVTMRERASGRSSIAGPATLYYMVKVSVALAMGRIASPHRVDD